MTPPGQSKEASVIIAYPVGGAQAYKVGGDPAAVAEALEKVAKSVREAPIAPLPLTVLIVPA